MGVDAGGCPSIGLAAVTGVWLGPTGEVGEAVVDPA